MQHGSNVTCHLHMTWWFQCWLNATLCFAMPDTLLRLPAAWSSTGDQIFWRQKLAAGHAMCSVQHVPVTNAKPVN
jgi:hypothetical protein